MEESVFRHMPIVSGKKFPTSYDIHVQNCLLLGSALTELHLIHTITPCLSMFNFNIIIHAACLFTK
jgi:hypothetical protein